MENNNTASTAQKKKTESIPFWIKRDDGIYCVDESVFSSFSMYQAIGVAISTHQELQKQLLTDAVKGSDKKVKGVKISDALMSSLNKIEELFPNIMEHANFYTKNEIH